MFTYTVTDDAGQEMLIVKEEKDSCRRCCFGRGRPFTMHITDNSFSEVITLRKTNGAEVQYGTCFVLHYGQSQIRAIYFMQNVVFCEKKNSQMCKFTLSEAFSYFECLTGKLSAIET